MFEIVITLDVGTTTKHKEEKKEKKLFNYLSIIKHKCSPLWIISNENL